jgi:hypothetical protein
MEQFPSLLGGEHGQKEKENMRKGIALLAMVLIAAVTSTASAVDSAWFQVNSLNCGVVVDQGPGRTLVIDKTGCTDVLIVNVGFWATSQNDTMAGYAIDLDGNPADAAPYFASNLVHTGGFPNTGGAAGPAPNLITNANGLDLNGQAVGAGRQLFQFDLSLLKVPGQAGPVNIFGDYGLGAMAYSSGYAWYGTVGANGPSYGIPGYNPGGFGSLPVISIIQTVVPEPATMALLGIGAICMLRRRR